MNYNKTQYQSSQGETLIDCTCDDCDSSFKRKKRYIQDTLKRNKNNKLYCNPQCFANSRKTHVNLDCKNCQKPIQKTSSEVSRSKTGRFFCNRSCAATYNNTHKTHGTRRSKMEAYLESVIISEFPTLKLICNDKTAIDSELDFYFPDLKFAIELNGIFHYEPIYGQDKLDKIQNNDNRKIIACYEKGIELAIIDSSSAQNMSAKNKSKFSRVTVEVISLMLSNRA